MKTIIVPMDFTNEALTGLNLSLMLANKIGANIVMVHVLRKNVSVGNLRVDSDYNMVETKLNTIYNDNKHKIDSKFNLSFVIKEGEIYKEITTLTETYENALLVLSTHGQAGSNEWFIGGNSYKITTNSTCPVITASKEVLSTTIKKIVIPLDFKYATREKVPYTVELAQDFDSEIHLINLESISNPCSDEKMIQYTNQVKSYIENHNIKCIVTSLQGENFSDLIIDYARTVNADLISIMTEQEKIVSNLLWGSFARQMINKSIIPVLSYPGHQKCNDIAINWDLSLNNIGN